jgi:hypothetical protein
VIEIVQRHDEANGVLAHELGERRHVPRIRDSGDEGPAIGVVQRGCQRIRVGTEGHGSGVSERLDDVDPLAGAREQHYHERREYSEALVATPLT